ncbi:MAG: hypothetical protein ACRCUM_04200 [Mycoplasmoidaceae bacterium]
MQLKPIREILNKSQVSFIEKKAYNYAKSEAKNTEEMELLFSKYFLQFMQESLINQ